MDLNLEEKQDLRTFLATVYGPQVNSWTINT